MPNNTGPAMVGTAARDPEGDALAGLLSACAWRCSVNENVIEDTTTAQAGLLQRLHCSHDLLGIRHGGDVVLLDEANNALLIDDHYRTSRDAAF
jgi:hypothetical protein